MNPMDVVTFLNHPFVFALLFMGLDLWRGDPPSRYHPIRLLGQLLQWLETRLFEWGLDQRVGGILLALCLVSIGLAISEGGYWLLSRLHPLLGWAWHLYLAYSLFALKDLCDHGKKVAEATSQQKSAEARRAVSLLVGRDTDQLDLKACNRAAMESLSENLSDGVIAPLFYYVLWGVPGMVIFKVVSTMDSMIGYKNERYHQFGWFGARSDDVMNYLPARMTWLLIAFSAFLMKTLSGKEALKYGYLHHARLPGPNAGWPQAAVAGAFNLQLVGEKWKNGRLQLQAWIGPQGAPYGAESHHVTTLIHLNFVAASSFLGFWGIGLIV